MSDTAVGSTTSLTSDDNRKIFDLVDSLSSHGINNYLDLPQIIVCGDQSSGKSSALEAISRVPFPVQDGLCTRFPTEIVLRRQEKTDFRATVNRPDGSIADVTVKGSTANLTNKIAVIMDAVKRQHMGLSDSNPFSSNILRIEIAGPDQPNLTLVDLPGLFEAATSTQSVKDAKLVKKMVVSYMKKRRSIILAVVSAANEFPLQQVTQRAREIDPFGERTMGLITKPDKLDRDSNNESASRDRLESEFFVQAPWNTLPGSRLGVEALKSRLSQVLHNHILEHIPTVLSEIRMGINHCEITLELMGQVRESQKEQRAYLIDISQRFTNLLRDAVKGYYSDRFFTDVDLNRHNHRRLRAIVRKHLVGFSKNMHDNGCAENIVTGVVLPRPGNITRQAYIGKVQAMLENYRGCELPGTFNPMIVGELFKRQIVPWQDLVSQVIGQIVNDVTCAAAAMVKHVAPMDVAKHIQSAITEPEIHELGQKLADMAHQLLVPLEDFHPMTQNHYLTENVQKAKKDRQELSIRNSVLSFLGEARITQGNYNGSFQVDQLVKSIADSTELTEPNMDKYAASLATDMVEAYYKVALKKFIDDFEVNVVEVCLMQKLPNLFSPLVVAGLSDETINEIAGENEDKIQKRQNLQDKLTALQKGETLMLQFGSGTE
ncbi:hypothetical protein PG996_005154 [Apiospora saccharicola]|uniref:GED domain-containing protein n=1 Tax=Apiospora saccharicola TaxID=335842 RepID=A0ABR1VKP3_9PEZI